MKTLDVYGIGNPLIDILVDVADSELSILGVDKGVMHLVEDEKRNRIISHIESKPKKVMCGGDCPNTMIALSNLGVKAAIAGKIGADDFGAMYDEQILSHKVISRLKKGSGHTGSSVILITPDSERTMNTHLGMCRNFTKEDVDEDMISSARFMYFTGYLWDTESQKEAILHAVSLAEKHGTKVVFDVADPFAVKRYRQEFLRLIEDHADIVFANEAEAKLLFDVDDAESAVSRLSSLCSIAIVKVGEHGAFVKKKDSGSLFIPSRKVKAVDTTGAGDIFASGFLYGLCKGMSLRDSGIFASYLASHIVAQKGAQFSKEKVSEILSDIKSGAWDFTSGL